MKASQSGPWPWLEGEERVDQPISGEGVSGGEGQVSREQERAMAHLLVCLDARNGGRRRLIGVGQSGGGRVRQR